MARFDTGEPASALEQVLEALAATLMFPVVTAVLKVDRLADWFPGRTGYLPFILNSCLWALCLVHLAGWVRRIRGARAHIA
jgi:hypothetical protein